MIGLRKLTIDRKFYDAISAGTKTLEVRARNNQVKNIEAGDRLHLGNYTTTHPGVFEVVRVTEYRTFEEMLSVEDATQIVPGATAAEVQNVLQRIYPPAKESRGVLVFELRKVG